MITKISLIGATGRMGKVIIDLASSDPQLEIIAGIGHSNSPFIGKLIGNIKISSDLNLAISQSDVIIDFSLPSATTTNLKVAQKYKKPIVIGTTGFDEKIKTSIAEASKTIPICQASNFSLGINILKEAVKEVAKMIPDYFDIDIIEAHHTQKKDSPSGTALTLEEEIISVRNCIVNNHSIRAGDIVGDHTVMFSGIGERLMLSHQAQSRSTFAKGALTVAKLLTNKTPGMYSPLQLLQNYTKCQLPLPKGRSL